MTSRSEKYFANKNNIFFGGKSTLKVYFKHKDIFRVENQQFSQISCFLKIPDVSRLLEDFVMI